MSPSFRRASPSFGSCCKACRYSRIAFAKSFLAAYSSAFLTWAAGEVFPQAHTINRAQTPSVRTNLSMAGRSAKALPTAEIAPAIDLKCAGWQTFWASRGALLRRPTPAQLHTNLGTKFDASATSSAAQLATRKFPKHFGNTRGLVLAARPHDVSGGHCEASDETNSEFVSGWTWTGGNRVERVGGVCDLHLDDDRLDEHDPSERVHVAARRNQSGQQHDYERRADVQRLLQLDLGGVRSVQHHVGRPAGHVDAYWQRHDRVGNGRHELRHARTR